MPGYFKNPGKRVAMRRRSSLALCGLLALILLAGCQSGAEKPLLNARQQPIETSFKLEKGKKVLIVPFECDIFSGSYAEAAGTVQKTFAGWTLYALQEAGVHADVYTPDRAAQSGATAPGTYLPLTPDSRLSRTASGNLSATPLHDNQWERSDFAGELTAGELAGRQYADDHVVSSGTVLLSPPSETGSGVSAMALGADDAPLVEVAAIDDGQDVQTQSERDKALAKAAKGGYDYVLVGNIIFLHSEVKPVQSAGKRSATTVRGEFASTYRLLDADNGEIMASGALTGKAGKYLALGSGVYNDSTINNTVSRVLNETMSATARNTAAKLMTPSVRLNTGVLNGLDSDDDYYRDSPGKMRRISN
ncbi:hypothetical protein LJC48_02970 [Desulfovibrio sp. OttesenSCG-928-C06]|nr:hypothetical protein [Desulfovibrio sp. OttesenSCG-928-C06]